jgi:hypothetical protein
MSFVTQSNKAITPASAAVVGGDNTSFTAQFGDNNMITATQKTADASGEFGGFANGYGNASVATQIGTGNTASINQNGTAKQGDFSPNPGTFNSSGALQIGNQNNVSVKQGGSTAGNFGSTTADQAANDTNASFVGQVGAKNDAGVTQANGANTQATFQVGRGNSVTIGQKTQALGTGNGANNALTTQAGSQNKVTLAQKMAVPLALGDNNSLITQVGGSNVVNATQTTGQQAMASNNTQVALQVGYDNRATVSQATGANVANTSFTAQYGAHNVAVVSQK